MRKHALVLFIVMLFVLPTTLSFVTVSGGSNLQNETTSVLSYEEKETKHLASGGNLDSDPFTTGDYWDTWVDDASYLTVDSSFYMSIYLIFNITETRPFEELNFFLRWQVVLQGGGPVPTMNWRIYNFDTSTYDTIYSYVLTTTLNWENREESITFDEKYVNATNHVRFYVTASTAYADSIAVDYAYLTVTKGYDGEFRETLPADVLYYPDPLRHLASGGNLDIHPFISGDYWDTWVDDTSYLTADSSFSVGINLHFHITEYANFIVDNATLSIFLRWQVVRQGGGDVPEMYWKIYNFDTSTYDTIYSYVLTTTLNWENREESITFDEKYVNATNHVKLFVSSNSTYADSIAVDYAYVTATTDYTESFADVSDWAYEADGGLDPEEYGMDTDGDVGRIWITPDDNGAYEWVQYAHTLDTAISREAYVSWAQYGGPNSRVYVTLEDSDSNTWTVMAGGIGEYWYNHHAYISTTLDDVKKIVIKVMDYPSSTDSGTCSFSFDYIRIDPANETGWQHDGSTASASREYFAGAGVGTISSDGDKLRYLGNHTDVGGFILEIDDTANESSIRLSDYPFLEININASVGQDIRLRLKDEDGGLIYYTEYVETNGFTIMRLNLLSTMVGNYLNEIGIYDQTDNLQDFSIDYVKVYSMANYKVTESSTTSDDFLYVEAGVLYSNMDDGYFILDYDPTFFLNGSYSWEKYPSLGTSYLSFNHGGWTDYSNETTGYLFSGTTTGLRIKFNETTNIIKIEYSVPTPIWRLIGTAIIYFDMPNWWVIGIAGAVFYIPLGTLTLQFLLMIMGLVMIPFSTLFLVKGGREEMDRDKLYFFLLIFLIGWALVLGGIL